MAVNDLLVAYASLRAAGMRPVLFEGRTGHPEAGHAFIACAPDRELVLEPDRPEAVRTALALPVAGSGGFTSGWAGYLDYEAACLFEPTLPAPNVPVVGRMAHYQASVHQEGTELVLKGEASLFPKIRAALAKDVAPASCSVGPFDARIDEEAFVAAAERIRALVHEGDLFQANLATAFEAAFEGDPAALYGRLRASNPGPCMMLGEWDRAIVSTSPELLFAVEEDRIRSRPIAGTRRRGRDDGSDARMEAELRTDVKEQAEHTMLVDLVRNDLARVAKTGTVEVPERHSIERYQRVMHLVSRVEGTLRAGTTLFDVLAAVFPGGTITGAPKHRAMTRIHEAERTPRGPYTGSAGWVGDAGGAWWNILIRTAVIDDGRVRVHAGSGIVAGSDARREWKEAVGKADALLQPAATPATRLGEVTMTSSWRPPRARAVGGRVLLIDNYDSFVHNLADYAAACGANTLVIRNDADWKAAVATYRPTHVIVSPGPGWPEDAGASVEIVGALHEKLPILGVCLGHQAIALAFGGRVVRGRAVHGTAHDIHHEGKDLLEGLPSPFKATRYHSLHVEATGPELDPLAWLSDGTIMAFRHHRRPVYGFQFHPESICTDVGLELVARFLGRSP